MTSGRDVKALRKQGKLDEALQLGREQLQQHPDDLWLKRDVGWVYYDLVKQRVKVIEQALKASHQGNGRELTVVHGLLQDFARLKLPKPDLVLSSLLFQISKIGSHASWFLPFLIWCGENPFRDEDFKPSAFNGNTYSPWAVDVAREAAAWVKGRPDAGEEHITFVLQFVHMVYTMAKDTDKTLLEWDLVHLLRRSGDQQGAAEYVAKVLKSKRTESWAWAGAARVHRDEQPDLALACFCQALRLGDKPEMLVRVHRELAELLAEMGDAGQASCELAIVLDIYQRNNWRLKPEISDLLQEDWYDPSLLAVEPAKFYAEHADDALILCFDEVRQVPATFLGMTEQRDDKKPKPRYAVTLEDRPVSILGRRGPRLLKSLGLGSPVSLLIGIDGWRKDILEVLPRSDGRHWDCAVCKEGVVVWNNSADGFFIVYCARGDELRVSASAWTSPTRPAIGVGVRLHGATNPKRERFEVTHAEPIPMPPIADAGKFTGRLSRTNRGFGFIRDVYVPQDLLDEKLRDGEEYTVVAVPSFDRKKDRHGWQAVSITASA